MKKHLLLLATLSLALLQAPLQCGSRLHAANPQDGWFKRYLSLKHMNAGLTAGSTGIGFEADLMLNKWVSVRTGYVFTPHLEFTNGQQVLTTDESTIADLGLDRMNSILKDVANIQIDGYIARTIEPKYNQFKFLVDVRPFRNKNWNLTVGFYAGPSKMGTCYMVAEDVPTMLGVNVYNQMYIKACKGDPIFADGTTIGGSTLPSVSPSELISEDMRRRGILGLHFGHFKDGDIAMLVPDEGGMVQADMTVNKFRPYVGFAYKAPLSKDHKWHFGVEAGAIFWGGTPHVYTDHIYKINGEVWDPANEKYEQNTLYRDPKFNQYDIVRQKINPDGSPIFDDDWNAIWEVDETQKHVDMANDLDLTGVSGKMTNLLKIVKKVPIYPNISVTLSYHIF